MHGKYLRFFTLFAALATINVIVLNLENTSNQSVPSAPVNFQAKRETSNQETTLPLGPLEATKRDVFIVTAHHRSIATTATFVNRLFNAYNRKFRNSILIFHEPDQQFSEGIINELKINFNFVDGEISLLEFHDLNFTLPKELIRKFNQSGRGLDKIIEEIQNGGKVVFSHLFPRYHQILNFWFSQVFKLKALDNVEYYWRLDTDSEILNKIPYNVFDFMRSNNFKYGYRVEEHDPSSVTQGLWQFVDNFVRIYRINPANENLASNLTFFKENKDEEKLLVPLFYTNFEICHVPTFRENNGIEQFSKQVERSLKIFTKRWGDAPLRWLQVGLFIDPKFYHQFCDIEYFHQRPFPKNCSFPTIRS